VRPPSQEPVRIGAVNVEAFSHNLARVIEEGGRALAAYLKPREQGQGTREFAEELYRRLQRGSTLGDAVMAARQAAASTPDDPTWLAYTVYGDPRATITRSP